MSLALEGKVALVTGAGRGLGRQTAIHLAAQGAEVILVSRNASELGQTEQIIREGKGRAWSFPADVSQLEAVAQLSSEISRRMSWVSILVNAAGVFGPIQLIRESDPQRWVQTIAVNLLAPYFTCHALVGKMIEHGWGRIINFTSAAALHPPGPLNSAYGTSKTALNQMTRHLAAELTGTGVTANVLHPGDVKTEMWGAIRAESEQLGAVGEPYRKWVRWVEETGGDDPRKAAELVLRLVSDAGANINGQFLWIENGLQAPLPSWGETASAQPWR